MSFHDQSREYTEAVQEYLKSVHSVFFSEPQTLLFDAMRYSLLAGGKRLRPILAFEFCRMCCGQWRPAMPYAAAVEMIHTYSLIHDDLPCMDNDDYRRGRLTNHKVYGEGMAVLAGDALLTDAFMVAARAKTDRMAQAIETLSQCAGSLGMVGGQVLDILSEERVLNEQEVLDIQSRKTGALIKAACVLGSIAGGADDAQLEAAASFADNLGLAFQIRDDMLDVIGTREEMGKGVGTDENKNTFVRLYGLEKCEELVNTYTEQAVCALSAFDSGDFLTELARSMTCRRT